MEEERRNHCNSHECTMEEIRVLKEENNRIRRELNEIKETIQGFKDFEDLVIKRYQTRQNKWYSKLMRFFHKEEE